MIDPDEDLEQEKPEETPEGTEGVDGASTQDAPEAPAPLLGRIPIRLRHPIPQKDGSPLRVIYIGTMRGRQALLAGAAPVIRARGEDLKDNPQKLKRLEDMARAVACACSITPKVVNRQPEPGELCVDDIHLEDVWEIYVEAVPMSASVFYGTDRTMDGRLDAALKQHQLEVLKFEFRCCRELGVDPLMIRRLENEERAYLLSLIQAGDALRAEHPALFGLAKKKR